MSHVEIQLDGACHGTVKIDGKELQSVTRAEFIADVGDGPPKVRLDVIVTNGHVVLEESDTDIRPQVVTR